MTVDVLKLLVTVALVKNTLEIIFFRLARLSLHTILSLRRLSGGIAAVMKAFLERLLIFVANLVILTCV